MGDSDHFDKNKAQRKGWWQKKEDGQPIPSYRDSCKSSGNGYLSSWHQAHHTLPAVSIRRAAEESNKDQDYIEDIKYITDWNINNPDNMIGLPMIFCYQLYYGRKTEISLPTDRYKRYFAWFNRFAEAARKTWLDNIISESPENHPIHNPVSWGHVDYNKVVRSQIKCQVWDQVDEQRKKHKLDAENVKKAMETLQQIWMGKLKSRGATSKALWEKVTTSRDMAALKPYTMHKVSKHPLFG